MTGFPAKSIKRIERTWNGRLGDVVHLKIRVPDYDQLPEPERKKKKNIGL